MLGAWGKGWISVVRKPPLQTGFVCLGLLARRRRRRGEDVAARRRHAAALIPIVDEHHFQELCFFVVTLFPSLPKTVVEIKFPTKSLIFKAGARRRNARHA